MGREPNQTIPTYRPQSPVNADITITLDHVSAPNVAFVVSQQTKIDASVRSVPSVHGGRVKAISSCKGVALQALVA